MDPFGITEDSRADFILLTHPHYDSFSEEDIARVREPDTVVVAPTSMKKQLGEVDHFLHPGDMIQLDRIDILAVPAHNQGRNFHLPESRWVGYVFTVDGVTYYHAGHTDFLDSMAGIRCDVVFVPCCSDYTMGPTDAARTAEACGASILVPIHWGDRRETLEEEAIMEQLFSGEVRVLERKA